MQQLADKMDTQRAQVNKLEKGHIQLKEFWLVKLSKALECDISDILLSDGSTQIPQKDRSVSQICLKIEDLLQELKQSLSSSSDEITMLELFRWGGAVFLAVYGFMAAKRAWTGGSALQASGETAGSLAKALTACLAFTFLNPHVYLDTVVLLGSIAAQYGESRWIFAAGAIVASVVWFTGLGFGARLLQPFFANPKAWQVLDGLIAVVMWAIAATLAAHPLA